WPFLPSQRRAPDKEKRWWDECFLSELLERVWDSNSHWHVIYGARGSGKSLALAALKRRAENISLILDYPARHLPGAPQSLLRGNNLTQIMALASLELRRLLTAQPRHLVQLASDSRVFVRWLIQKFGGERAYAIWLSSLPSDSAAALRDVAYQDLYATDTHPEHIHGQIQELVSLIQQLGYQQVLVVLDVEINLNDEQRKSLRELFSEFDIHHPRFLVIAAVPEDLIRNAALMTAPHPRVNFVRLTWTTEQCRRIADRHIHAATDGALETMQALAEPTLLDTLEQMILQEFQEPVPRGAVDLARLLLHAGASRTSRLHDGHLTDLRQKYFAENMPLILDITAKRRGVWRGPRFIELDE